MSLRIVGQVGLADGADANEKTDVARLLEEHAREIEGVQTSHAGVHLDLSVGGGELTWDLLFEGDAAVASFCDRLGGAAPSDAIKRLGGRLAALDGRVSSLELAIPETLDGHVGVPDLVGIKRTLWLRVMPEADAELVAAFEKQTPLLAAAVPAIRNWRWSRVRTSDPNPMALRWTHLWEQEFETVDGLQVDYMSSPAHWGFIDRWFDPEMPDRVVDLWISHLACPETTPVLSWDVGRYSGSGR